MDILKKLEVHIGTNNEGTTILLAKKPEIENLEFQDEMKKLFNIRTI